MVKNLKILNGVWFTKKRKVMLAVLTTFVACSSVYKVAARDTYEIQSSSPRSGSYVKAGGWICNNAMFAVSLAQMRSAPSWQVLSRLNGDVKGCTKIGSSLRVNILDNTQIGNISVTEVGNPGGTGWVLPDDIE